MKDITGFVEAGYDDIANAYHEAKDPNHNIDLLVKFCSLYLANSRVLDIGCGAGVPVSKYLSSRGHSVIGIDISNKMLNLARKNVPSGRFIRMNMVSIDFEDNSFDALVSSYAIFHVPRDLHALIYRSFFRVLKPNGKFLISIGFSDWEGVEDFYGINMYWSHYAWDNSVSLLENSGLEVLHSETREPPGDGRHVWIIGRNTKENT